MSKNDPTDSSGPESLGDVLGRLFTSRGWGRHQERVRFEKAWAIVAADYREETRVLTFRRRVLEIEVRNPVLMQELAQFHKRTLLTNLKKVLSGVALNEIKFRSGTW